MNLELARKQTTRNHSRHLFPADLITIRLKRAREVIERHPSFLVDIESSLAIPDVVSKSEWFTSVRRLPSNFQRSRDVATPSCSRRPAETRNYLKYTHSMLVLSNDHRGVRESIFWEKVNGNLQTYRIDFWTIIRVAIAKFFSEVCNVRRLD